MIGLGIPPIGGEANAAYTVDVCSKLSPAWHMDWRYTSGLMGDDDYVPMIWWLRQTEPNFVQGLDMAAAHPDKLWLIGNEPELNGVTPLEAVRAMNQWRKRFAWSIETALPGVNISMHIIGQALAWLEQYVNKGGVIPDNWHVHIYGDAPAFEESLSLFEQWMGRKGVRQPVIVSEFGSATNPGYLMHMVEGMLKAGRLNMAAWFSAYYEAWNETGLLTADGDLTEIGELYTAERHMVYLPTMVAG